MKFTGDTKGLSFNAFFKRCEEFRVVVSKQTLLESGIELFEGRGYQFYVAYRHEVSTSDNFVGLMYEEYLPRHMMRSYWTKSKGVPKGVTSLLEYTWLL